MLMKTCPIRAAKLLGLLDPEAVPEPSGSPLLVEQHGHWRVAHYGRAVKWTCKCGRSEPVWLTARSHSLVRLPDDGIHACEVCRSETFAARTKTQRFAAWLEQNRACISPEECLEFPETLAAPKVSERERFCRTRRFVFEQFWRKPLHSGDYVRLKCSNERCINPYHLCLTSSPKTKLTPEDQNFLHTLLQAQISTSTIQELLREKRSVELSTRSIQRIRKELTQSESCVS